MKISSEEAFLRLKHYRGDSIPVNRVMARNGESALVSENMELVRRVVKKSEDKAYLFKDGNTAFLTPADDVLPPILAEFEVDEDSSDINPLALAWISNIGAEIDWLQQHNYFGYENTISDSEDEEEDQENIEEESEPTEEANANTSNIEEEPEFIDKLLGNIQWLQQSPFKDHNYYKVVESPTRSEVGSFFYCVVGCPALATAQVLFYLYKIGYPFGCVRTPSYISRKTSGYRHLIPETSACVKFDFANMLDRYTKRKKTSSGGMAIVNYDPSNPPTTTQKNAVAQLCAHIGRAGKTGYSKNVSGMWMDDLSNVLYAGFGIKNTYYSLKKIENFTSTDINRIKNSLRKGLPVIMSGSGSGGAHCFICDGYRESDNTFHFNWGYGPNYSDGWYRMTTLDIVDIEPSDWDNLDRTIWADRRDYIIIDPKDSPADPWIYDINKDRLINMVDVTKAINIMNTAYVTSTISGASKVFGNCIRPVRDNIPSSSEHGYVDFELPSGTIWATSNIGAYEDPYDCGDFIGWQRTEGYGNTCPSKYETIDYSNIQQLDAPHDAATVRWGDGWKTPTKEQWEELKQYCNFAIEYESDSPTRRACIKVSRRREGPDSDVPRDFILLPTGGQIVANGTTARNSGFYWSSTNCDTKNKKAYQIRMDCILPKASDVTLADVNYDGVVDTADVQAIIDYILGRNR